MHGIEPCPGAEHRRTALGGPGLSGSRLLGLRRAAAPPHPSQAQDAGQEQQPRRRDRRDQDGRDRHVELAVVLDEGTAGIEAEKPDPEDVTDLPRGELRVVADASEHEIVGVIDMHQTQAMPLFLGH